MEILDCHAHRSDAEGAIINVSPRFDAFVPDRWYSAGIHPWDSGHVISEDYEWLEMVAQDSRVVAIGECGFDKYRGGIISLQREVFVRQALLSESVCKPLIIHCVKCVDELLRVRRDLKPRQPWIYHGFRYNAEVARALTSKGIYLSYGEKFNAAAVAATPRNLLLVETDESRLSVYEIADRLFAGAVEVAKANLRRVLKR